MVRHVPRSLRFVVLGLCFLSVPLAAEEPRPVKPALAKASLTPTRVEWLPSADHQGLTLTVAGPDDFYLQRELRAGETLSFSALDFQDNRLPDGVYAYELRAEGAAVQSGHLWVQDGQFVDRIPADVKPPIRSITALEEVIPEDLIVQGHACIGGDCVSGDASDTTPLKIKGEFANRQILFDGSCCYPTERDWALQVVDPSAGPNGDFVLRDLTSATIPFKVGGGAPDNAFTILYNGNIGLGTLTPGAKLHLYGSATSDVFQSFGPSPASGPAFNIGYGGTSFGRGAAFLNVRPDASAMAPNPSIRILTANVERMIVTNAGNVGIGTTNPAAHLEVTGGEVRFPPAGGVPGYTHFNLSDGKNYIRGTTIIADNGGSVGIGTTSPSSRLHVNGGDIRVSGGSFIDDGTTLNVPDYVFEPEYRLMPLDELRDFVVREKHLPNVPTAETVKKEGLNLSQVQMRLLEKLEELTLYTLKQDEQVKVLQSENARLNARLEALEQASETKPQ